MDTSKARYIGSFQGWNVQYLGFDSFSTHGEYHFGFQNPYDKRWYAAVIKDDDRQEIIHFDPNGIPEFVAVAVIDYYCEQTGITARRIKAATAKRDRQLFGAMAGLGIIRGTINGLFG